jgi:alpha-beta hydrolase superfamily lysophospholipase
MAVASCLLIVALYHLVAGWFFSNGLQRETLLVRPRPRDLGVWVRAIAPGRIELESKQPRQDIGHPGILGIRWSGGYAQVGEVVAAADGRISRSFTPGIDGTPPICQGPLDDCEPIELDGYAYPNDPGDVGLDFSEVEYHSPLGVLAAWLVPSTPTGLWAIHCHGWTAERRELIRMLPTFHEQGLTSLVIDYRGDPGAPTDPSGHYRFGVTEWQDLEGAVRYALDGGAEAVVLTGCSTGGALVLGFLERSDLADRVSGVVLDAPNIVLADTFRHALDEVRGTQLVKEMGMWITDLRWHIDWETTNYVQRANQFLHVPTLVFHGTSDLTVPISSSRQLQAAVPDLVELIETPAAGHVLSWNADPERYERYLAGFLQSL